MRIHHWSLGSIVKGQTKKMNKETLIIDTFEKFVEYNNGLKGLISLNIDEVDYERNVITVDGCEWDIDTFLFDFVTNKTHYIAKNIKLLKQYEFQRLYSMLYPEEFKENLYYFARNLLMLGETTFILWEFEVAIKSDNTTPFGLTIISYFGSKIRRFVRIPYGITAIGNSIFYAYHQIEKVELPLTIKFIGNEAFQATGLDAIEIPDSVEVICESAFRDCQFLRSVKLSNNLKYLGDHAFENTAIAEISIPGTVKEIGMATFYDNVKLRKVNLSEGLEIINPDAFASTAIERIKIPSTVTVLKGNSFGGCCSLREVKFSEGLKKIDYEAFSFDNYLKEIKIPDSVEEIGDSAFSGCKKLNKINIPINLTELGRNVFKETPIGDTFWHRVTKLSAYDGEELDLESLKGITIEV